MKIIFVELKGPVGQIIHPDKTVLAVEQNKVNTLAITHR